jgi:hypothetical protein
VLTRQWDDSTRSRERSRIELLGFSIAPAPAAGEPSKSSG